MVWPLSLRARLHGVWFFAASAARFGFSRVGAGLSLCFRRLVTQQPRVIFVSIGKGPPKAGSVLLSYCNSHWPVFDVAVFRGIAKQFQCCLLFKSTATSVSVSILSQPSASLRSAVQGQRVSILFARGCTACQDIIRRRNSLCSYCRRLPVRMSRFVKV